MTDGSLVFEYSQSASRHQAIANSIGQTSPLFANPDGSDAGPILTVFNSPLPSYWAPSTWRITLNDGGLAALTSTQMVASLLPWPANAGQLPHKHAESLVPTFLDGPTLGNKLTYTGQPRMNCNTPPAQDLPKFYGWVYCASYQLQDQNKKPLKRKGVEFFEILQLQDTNLEGVTLQEGPGATLAGGILKDMLGFGSKQQPLPNGSFILVKQTFTTEVGGDTKTLRINCIDSEISGVTVTDVTTQGDNASCSRQQQ